MASASSSACSRVWAQVDIFLERRLYLQGYGILTRAVPIYLESTRMSYDQLVKVAGRGLNRSALYRVTSTPTTTLPARVSRDGHWRKQLR